MRFCLLLFLDCSMVNSSKNIFSLVFVAYVAYFFKSFWAVAAVPPSFCAACIILYQTGKQGFVHLPTSRNSRHALGTLLMRRLLKGCCFIRTEFVYGNPQPPFLLWCFVTKRQIVPPSVTVVSKHCNDATR